MSRKTETLVLVPVVVVTAALTMSCADATGSRNDGIEEIGSVATTGDRAIHRAVSTSTGWHFYTDSATEAATAPARVEAYDYFYMRSSSGTGLVAFYDCRFASGKRFYTTSASCEGSGATNARRLGYLWSTAGSDRTALRRLFHPQRGDHVYSVRRAERDRLMADGHVDEGIVGHVVVPQLTIAAIYEGDQAAEVGRMSAALAPSGAGANVAFGWSTSTWYMGEVGNVAQDFQFNPARLDNKIAAARAQQIPLVVNLNGGRWAHTGALMEFLSASVPFFSLAGGGDQLLTLSETERRSVEAAGYGYQRLLGGIFRSAVAGTVPLFRLFRSAPVDRLYTTDPSERAAVQGLGYADEGVVGHVYPGPGTRFGRAARPLFRLLNESTGHHLYTTDAADRPAGYILEGEIGYLPDPWVSMDQNDYSMFRLPELLPNGEEDPATLGHDYLTLSRLNGAHYTYKRRNIQSAADRINAYRTSTGSRYRGVSLDSETMIADHRHVDSDWCGHPFRPAQQRYADYNPLVIEEWRQWLSATGLYHPTSGQYRGQGRSPAFTLAGFNAAMGTSFATWSAVTPPRARNDASEFWREWRRFTVRLVDQHSQDMADWIAARGLPRSTIYAHQTPALDPLLFGDDLATAELSGGQTSGITTYWCNAVDRNLLAAARARARHFGIFEWNSFVQSGGGANNRQIAFAALEDAYVNTARIIAPYAWDARAAPEGILSVNSPEGRPVGDGIADFIAAYGTADR